jgi:hypothetical protein
MNLPPMRRLFDAMEREMHWVEMIENRLSVEVEMVKGQRT